MPRRAITRKAVLRAVITLCLATAFAACDSGAGAASPGPTDDCSKWCGSGSATVVSEGTSTRIAPGACVDFGAAGIDARFGNWQEGGTGDYVDVTAYRVGGATPTPAPTQDLSASPSATDHANPVVSGSIAGTPFILGDDARVTMKDATGGTFSGTDVNGYGTFTGTFTCS